MCCSYKRVTPRFSFNFAQSVLLCAAKHTLSRSSLSFIHFIMSAEVGLANTTFWQLFAEIDFDLTKSTHSFHQCIDQILIKYQKYFWGFLELRYQFYCSFQIVVCLLYWFWKKNHSKTPFFRKKTELHGFIFLVQIWTLK